MSLDRYNNGYYETTAIRQEYNSMQQRIDSLMQEITYWKEKTTKAEARFDYLCDEIKVINQYVRVLELALHIASDDDTKKASFLEQAKKSIAVLKTFEK